MGSIVTYSKDIKLTCVHVVFLPAYAELYTCESYGTSVCLLVTSHVKPRKGWQDVVKCNAVLPDHSYILRFCTHTFTAQSCECKSSIICCTHVNNCNTWAMHLWTSLQSSFHCKVKVVQAIISRQASGKPSFNKLDQMFLNLKEATANISYVKHMIRWRWGAVYTLVTL